jgi:hypothetical protein
MKAASKGLKSTRKKKIENSPESKRTLGEQEDPAAPTQWTIFGLFGGEKVAGYHPSDRSSAAPSSSQL